MMYSRCSKICLGLVFSFTLVFSNCALAYMINNGDGTYTGAAPNPNGPIPLVKVAGKGSTFNTPTKRGDIKIVLPILRVGLFGLRCGGMQGMQKLTVRQVKF